MIVGKGAEAADKLAAGSAPHPFASLSYGGATSCRPMMGGAVYLFPLVELGAGIRRATAAVLMHSLARWGHMGRSQGSAGNVQTLRGHRPLDIVPAYPLQRRALT